MYLRIIFNSLRWLFIVLGVCGVTLGIGLHSLLLQWSTIITGILLFALGLLIFYWYLRPNRAQVVGSLQVESWDVTHDDMHNSNSDMLHWNGVFYLVHAVSPYHFSNPACHLVLLRSTDARNWERLARFSVPGEDIRDPKLAVIGDRLFLFALKNTSFDPEPYTTVYTLSLDAGQTWSPFNEVSQKGWLFWRPKTLDRLTWYVPAYWWEHGKAVLLRSNDGIEWSFHATIYEGDRNDETDFEFLSDGRMISTARLEIAFSVFGHPGGATLITTSASPYDKWEVRAKSLLTRLDGPTLFSYAGRVYAVGRYQPELGGPFTRQGSIFSRKRTSLFLLEEERLIYLSDLPSAGDTSYSGVAVQDGALYICYYTNDLRKDYPWIVGMFNPSAIHMVKIDLAKLEALTLEKINVA